MRHWYSATISALCYSLVRDEFEGSGSSARFECNGVVRFVMEQQRRMSPVLRSGILALTFLFSLQALLKYGRFFHLLSSRHRLHHLQGWKNSSIILRADLIRFYGSLAALAWFSRLEVE